MMQNAKIMDLLPIRGEIPQKVACVIKTFRICDQDDADRSEQEISKPKAEFRDVLKQVVAENRKARESSKREDDETGAGDRAEEDRAAQAPADEDAQASADDVPSREELDACAGNPEEPQTAATESGPESETAGNQTPGVPFDQSAEKAVAGATGASAAPQSDASIDDLLSQALSQNAADPAETDGNVSNDPQAPLAAAEQAMSIIRQSLITISQTLHIDLAGDLNALQAIRPTQDLKEQFAEIVQALEQIAGALADAASKGGTIEVKGQSFDVNQMLNAERTIRVELFQMRMAFQMLGVSGETTQDAAGKPAAQPDPGLPVATDPRTTTMPVLQAQKFFEQVIGAAEEEIKSVIRRIAATTEEQPGGSSEAKVIAAAFKFKARVSGQATPEVAQFDSMVMRRLLKIDMKEVTAAGQVLDGEDAQMPDQLTKSIKLGVHKSLFELQTKAIESLPAVDVSPKQGPLDGLLNVAVNKAHMLSLKTLDQTIMSQIIEKMNTVMKSGMTEIRLVLHPESLGEVHIKVKMQNDIVVAQIQVESQQVKQIVESNLQTLKDALQQQNLQTGGFEVNIGYGSNDAGEDGQPANANSIGSASISTGMESVDEPTFTLGTETGKSYGSNSVEYYA